MISDLLRQLKSAKPLVIGDVMVDRYWWGTVERVSPEAPVPVVSVDNVSVVAGGAANVAANIKGLGCQPVLVGLVGDDNEAGLLRTALEGAGLHNLHLHKIPGRSTIVKNRVVAHNQQMLRFDLETASPLDPSEASLITPGLIELVGECDVVVISDYAKGFLTREVLEPVIGHARKLGKAVVVDPKGRDYSKYRGASIVTPNQREAEEACGLPLSDENIDAAGARLIEDLEIDGAVITRGERGMRVYETGREPLDLPASARMVYNVTGAGDTVIACLGVGLANGLSLPDSARLANFAAGLVVENVGTTAISLRMLNDHLTPAEVQ